MTLPPGQLGTTAENRLRVGLIGCGKMGLQHLQSISRIPRAVVVGIADPAADAESLRPIVSAEPRIVTNVDQMLQDIRPDVVHIVTPPVTHAPLAMQALQAGCHVCVEKPFTLTTV